MKFRPSKKIKKNRSPQSKSGRPDIRFLKNLKLGRRIFISFTTVLIIVGILIGFIQVANINTIDDYSRIKDSYIYLISKTGEVNPEMRYIEGNINTYILTGSEDTYNDTLSHLTTFN